MGKTNMMDVLDSEYTRWLNHLMLANELNDPTSSEQPEEHEQPAPVPSSDLEP